MVFAWNASFVCAQVYQSPSGRSHVVWKTDTEGLRDSYMQAPMSMLTRRDLGASRSIRSRLKMQRTRSSKCSPLNAGLLRRGHSKLQCVQSDRQQTGNTDWDCRLRPEIGHFVLDVRKRAFEHAGPFTWKGRDDSQTTSTRLLKHFTSHSSRTSRAPLRLFTVLTN